jgi:hypothetical protein
MIVLGFGAMIAMQVSAAADEGYAFKFDNASNAAASVLVDGKSVCEIAAGGHCTVTVKASEHAYTVSLAGAAPVTFTPGNPEMADSCKIEAGGVHCIDPSGNATN